MKQGNVFTFGDIMGLRRRIKNKIKTIFFGSKGDENKNKVSKIVIEFMEEISGTLYLITAPSTIQIENDVRVLDKVNILSGCISFLCGCKKIRVFAEKIVFSSNCF